MMTKLAYIPKTFVQNWQLFINWSIMFQMLPILNMSTWNGPYLNQKLPSKKPSIKDSQLNHLIRLWIPFIHTTKTCCKNIPKKSPIAIMILEWFKRGNCKIIVAKTSILTELFFWGLLVTSITPLEVETKLVKWPKIVIKFRFRLPASDSIASAII